MVAQRAGITRKTLSGVERGDSTVAIGTYARVMQVLRLFWKMILSKLAADDPLGRQLQDVGLTAKRRAPKRSTAPSSVSDKTKDMQ